jgi:hypothetical protein
VSPMLELLKIKKEIVEDLVMLILTPLIMLKKVYLWLVPMLMADPLDVISLNPEPVAVEEEEAETVAEEAVSAVDVAVSAAEEVAEVASTPTELLLKEI